MLSKVRISVEVSAERVESRESGRKGASAVRALGRGLIDRPVVLSAPLCVLAQQLVATACDNELGSDDLYALVRGAAPYAELPPTFWEQHGSMVVLGAIVAVLLAALSVWLALRSRPVPPVSPEVQARRALAARVLTPRQRTSRYLRYRLTFPMTHCFATGPQTRLSALWPRLSRSRRTRSRADANRVSFSARDRPQRAAP